ncbi:hypothetical protein HN747_02460 [archaeon]|jgi:hypothetical protein|nr:hypothetical protein [archaeon]
MVGKFYNAISGKIYISKQDREKILRDGISEIRRLNDEHESIFGMGHYSYGSSTSMNVSVDRLPINVRNCILDLRS